MLPSFSNRKRCVPSAALVAFLGFLLGCVGATRLPTRANGPAGAGIQKKELDLSFVQVGSTHYEETLNRLAEIDTSYSNPRLFWGRWNESRWGYWWVVGFPCSSSDCAAGDAGRLWRIHNVLVTFDEHGVVTGQEQISDDRALWRTLRARIAETAPKAPDSGQPLRIPLVSDMPSAIVLEKDGMEFERSKSQVNVRVPVAQVVRFSHRGMPDEKSSPGTTCHALEFSEKTVFGKKVKFCAKAAEVGALFEYLQQAAPPGMKWE